MIILEGKMGLQKYKNLFRKWKMNCKNIKIFFKNALLFKAAAKRSSRQLIGSSLS
jgi:hypothetical protein